MKNLRKYALLGLAFTMITASCTIEKRSHMKGYHVSWNNGKNKTATQNPIVENNTPEIVTPDEVINIKSEVATVTPVLTTDAELVATAPKTMETTNNSTAPAVTVSKKEMKKAIKSTLKLAQNNSNETIVIPSNVNNASTTPTERTSPTQISNGGLLVIIITIFIPFLGVLLYEGLGSRFWVSLLLTLLFFLPGLIYSLLVVTGTI